GARPRLPLAHRRAAGAGCAGHAGRRSSGRRRGELLAGLAAPGARRAVEPAPDPGRGERLGGCEGGHPPVRRDPPGGSCARGARGRRRAGGDPGPVLTVDDLLSTLAVEAAVHHLDLVAFSDGPSPGAQSLTLVRETLDGLLGRPAPREWDDARYALTAP